MSRELYGEFNKQTYQLQPDQGEITIGRSDGNKIQLMYKDVSKHHARLISGPGDTLMIEDLESTRGTWLNGGKLDANRLVQLKDGDEISLVSTEKYLFRYKAPPAEGTDSKEPELTVVE